MIGSAQIPPNSQQIWIDYTNWRGERSVRRIQPVEIRWGSTQWHPEAQWLLAAVDLDKQAPREFALCDIHRISSQPLESTG